LTLEGDDGAWHGPAEAILEGGDIAVAEDEIQVAVVVGRDAEDGGPLPAPCLGVAGGAEDAPGAVEVAVALDSATAGRGRRCLLGRSRGRGVGHGGVSFWAGGGGQGGKKHAPQHQGPRGVRESFMG
jgi:hypothetical protein